MVTVEKPPQCARKHSLVYVPPGETRSQIAAEFMRSYLECSDLYPQIFQKWLAREWLAEERRTATSYYMTFGTPNLFLRLVERYMKVRPQSVLDYSLTNPWCEVLFRGPPKHR